MAINHYLFSKRSQGIIRNILGGFGFRKQELVKGWQEYQRDYPNPTGISWVRLPCVYARQTTREMLGDNKEDWLFGERPEKSVTQISLRPGNLNYAAISWARLLYLRTEIRKLEKDNIESGRGGNFVRGLHLRVMANFVERGFKLEGDFVEEYLEKIRALRGEA